MWRLGYDLAANKKKQNEKEGVFNVWIKDGCELPRMNCSFGIWRFGPAQFVCYEL